MNRFIGIVGAAWGALGVLAILVFAIYRLSTPALVAFDSGLSAGQWLVAVANVVFMAYSEGYRGFQQKFSPRTAARILYLRDRPDPVRTLLAPLVAMGYIHATRSRKIASYGLTLGIVVLVSLVRLVDQPWRGIIDAGVVVGLGWGVISLGVSIVQAFARPVDHPRPLGRE
jgi:hypothetical protein